MREERLYRIGEAAETLRLKTCVLRFWETEFPQLQPVRTPKGQRLYSDEHMALLRRIRSLLHEEGMTIAGARRVLEGVASAPKPAPKSSKKIPHPSAPHPAASQEQALLFSAFPVSPDPLWAEVIQELEGLRDLLQSSSKRKPS